MNNNSLKVVEVVAAVILFDNKFLCCQRGIHKFDYISYKYEFPGGKIEKNETPSQALIREIQEELNLNISVTSLIKKINYTYPDFILSMDCYLCVSENMDIKLNDHINYKLLKLHELNSLEWVPADIELVNYLVDNQIGQ